MYYCFISFFGYIKEDEVELIYDPETPCERVGQATVMKDPPKLLWYAIGFDWYHNPINATFKSGILYFLG